MGLKKNRWLFIISGFIINLCLGAIYAYSIIAVHLMKLFKNVYGLNVTATEIQLPFIVFLLVFALTMPMMGKYIEKYGPRKITWLGAIFVSLGWFLVSLASSSLSLVFLYGLIGGLGVGIVYNCPIVTSGKWFPDKRGLAVGLTILGFGFSAAIIGPLIDYLTAIFGIQIALKILGALFFTILFIFGSFLRFPSNDWKPKGLEFIEKKEKSSIEFTREEMVKTKSFYGLWITYMIGTLAGLMAIGISKLIGLEVAANAGINEEEISAFLTILIIPFSACNGFGRPLFGWITDKFTPMKAAILSFVLIFIASLIVFINPSSIIVYIIGFAILWLNLGGWLAIAPTATAYFFGMKDYARNYGIVFTAYGIGAIIGNILAGQAKDVFGAYVKVFPYIMALSILGIIIAIVLMKCPKVKNMN
ncbi:MAG: OFA family MFS transporter [Nitrososphaerota archaeon]